jgi:3'-phosphoadenosine 5'-phosphosulfate sulfotransferase (PAPS reductase)/FAD synthetase
MKPHIASALNLLKAVREETNAIGVAVSFGKDSFATLDLCCNVFDRVEGYYLFRVRNMQIVDEWSADVFRRWRVNIKMYPHFDLCRCYRHGVLSPHWKDGAKCPKVKLPDIEAKFRQDVDVEWLAMGWRRNDSFSRALIMKQNGGFDSNTKRVFPIKSWRRQDVYDYLDSRGIPLPPGFGRKDQGGLDFHAGALEHLRKNYPADYCAWIRDFPFSEMQLKIPTTCPSRGKA